VPPVKPVTLLVVDNGFTIVAAFPPVCVHVPVPKVGAIELKSTLVLHVSISAPALADTPLLLIDTSSNAVQPSLAEVTVHLKILIPVCKLFTRVLYNVDFVNVALPVVLHTPVPPVTDTSFPSKGS